MFGRLVDGKHKQSQDTSINGSGYLSSYSRQDTATGLGHTENDRHCGFHVNDYPAWADAHFREDQTQGSQLISLT